MIMSQRRIMPLIERLPPVRGRLTENAPLAGITDRSSLGDILADHLDRIGPVAGASVREILDTTSTMLSAPSSEQATPPEHRPDRTGIPPGLAGAGGNAHRREPTGQVGQRFSHVGVPAEDFPHDSGLRLDDLIAGRHPLRQCLHHCLQDHR